MNYENGIHQKKSGDVNVMINVTDKIGIAMKQGDNTIVITLDRFDVKQVYDEWVDFNNQFGSELPPSDNGKFLAERNQLLFERVFDQHMTLIAAREALQAVLRNDNNVLDGVSKQLIRDVSASVNDEINVV